MPLKFSYDFLLLLAAIYVCWKGGWAGRASVGALSVAYALSEYLYMLFPDEGEFVERLLIVDASLLMIQILIACSSRKTWLIWVAAFQLNTVLSEYAAWLTPSYKWSIFYLLATVWASPTIIVMVVGVWRDAKWDSKSDDPIRSKMREDAGSARDHDGKSRSREKPR